MNQTSLNPINVVLATLPGENIVRRYFVEYLRDDLKVRAAIKRHGHADHMLPVYRQVIEGFFKNLKVLEAVLEEQVIDPAASQSCATGETVKSESAATARQTGKSVSEAVKEPERRLANAAKDYALARVHLGALKEQADTLEGLIRDLYKLLGEQIPVELVRLFRSI